MNLKNNILATVIGLSGVCATAQAQMYSGVNIPLKWF